ncbi:RNA polymerase sigma factor [Paludisphaera mucosa]|uniref:Sigma-70 family RNA polymerase sigma factor n=1 Tax=Paludisphaera mucosa TaxID=3030827 RepID=A0ABT6F9E8_9BACT|nr:sigma-70 family RNA polymerase sigma factor [Paludisphaera mucosa]MDG3004215.1 sigma-70 family RNA polymerase sigma factor [Paludisphaera mucosa]
MGDDVPTSATLLDRARASDADAWARLVYLYGPLVRHWCARWGCVGADADDLVQEIFLAVAAGLPGFRRERAGDTFRGWLRTIARNKRLDALRRGDRDPVAQGGTEAQWRLAQAPGPEAEADEDPIEQVSGLYHRALELVRSEFEEKTWRTFWRVAVDGLTVDAVAREAGVAPAAVRQAKSRVLRRLKQEVGDLI